MKFPNRAIRRTLMAILLSMTIGGAIAADATKDPLSYPLRQYGFLLGTALLGGLVSWYAKVRRGDLSGLSVMQLVGELATSAFAGLLCFWICESMNSPPLLTASLVGIAGHMGARAIATFEDFAQKRWGSSHD